MIILKDRKVAVLHPQVFEVGGAVNMMIYLSNFLFERGASVVFFTTKFKKENFSKEINFPLKVVNFNFKIISYIVMAYKIRKYEVVFIGNSPMHFVGVLSKILFRSKARLFWWNHHYPWYYEKKHSTFFVKIKRIFEKKFVNYIDVLIANSYYIKNSLEKIFPGKQVKVLYPRVKDIFYDICDTKDIQKSKINIFTYSRWVKGKNIKLIFDTFEKLNKNFDFSLFIGGEGNELEYFKNKYSKNKNIKFLGLLDDSSIIKYSKTSDIFLFPSKVDSFGIVVLEAMFFGLPIVGFDSGGVIELIKNGENGFLVKSDKDFIEKTKTLLLNETLRKNFSKKSFSFARSNFNRDIFKKQLEEILS